MNLINTNRVLKETSKQSLKRCSNVIKIAALACLAAYSRPASAQMVTGGSMKDFGKVFGTTSAKFDAGMINSSAPGNILWPGEQPRFRFQITNTSGKKMQTKGRVRLVAYGTQGIEGDIWTPQVVGKGLVSSTPIQIALAQGKSQEFAISPQVPARFGAYALVVNVDGGGSRFLLSFIRTFKAETRRVQYPHFCLDALPLPVLKRLGVQAIRYGVGYKPTTDKDFKEWYAEQGAYLNDLKKANVAVLFMPGAGAWFHPNQPMGRPRPWLDDKGVMLDTKTDIAWLPSYDKDFQEYTRRFATDYGWPRGPINAFSLWNEPWEGISISGWGADMLRYRDMYRHMARGVLDARKTGVQVLVGGADSTSNANDKFFGDEAGKREFLPIFDFLSIHYQGLSSSANIKEWRNRKGYNGRVQIWDTESWVANADDRVASVVAANRAAGYDRAMGVYGGNVADGGNTWSVAAAIGATQHFIGERPFKQMLFRNGLPWVMQFDGEKGRPEDGTLVVVGDLGDAFGADNLLFRTARGQAEVARKAQLQRQLAALPVANASDAVKKKRAEITAALAKNEVLSGASMTINAPAQGFRAYDYYGNVLPLQNGKIKIALNGRGVFLRAGGAKGSFARLVEAVRRSSVQGIEPLATVARDLTAPIGSKPSLQLELTNVLNRPVKGRLNVSLTGVRLGAVRVLDFAAGETKIVKIPVLGGTTRPDNSYPLSLRFDAGRDGIAVHQEVLHVNVVARRSIEVDGVLDDWNGIAPQTILTDAAGGPSVTEAAWYSFKKLDAVSSSGIASGYVAYDAKNFYFAARIADSTPHEGMVRFATRDDDAYFYPQISYQKAGGTKEFSVRWTGEIEAPTSGEYIISTVTDDGARLWLDDKMLIEDWEGQAAAKNSTTVTLKAGQRLRVRMEYFQGAGASSARLLWQRPDAEEEAIPQQYLYSGEAETPNAKGNGLRGEYFRGTELNAPSVVVRTDSQVDFEWKENEVVDPKFDEAANIALQWPEGVRRYSYRKDPDLPAGNFPNADNVQLAFNVLPEARKLMYDTLPGLPPKFTSYADTDYEYALNTVAAKYGGGTEIWRSRVPGMPSKHFYPRQPKSKFDGPAKNGQLVTKRDDNIRFVEAAIPWEEMPDVKRRLDANQPIKFTFRVNDDKGDGTMELARGRSVSKTNFSTFHVEWRPHWSNELEFGWGK